MPIEHVVVLMLENRSFDSMFGKLYPSGAGFNGLTGNEQNVSGGKPCPVWNDQGMGPATACIPDPDPGELHYPHMNFQIFGYPDGEPIYGPPPMSGFAENYAQLYKDAAVPADPMAVMHYFTEQQTPVLSSLAKAFGVSDQWHASAPCQTWPNRFFAHCATAHGHVDNFPAHFPYLMPTIYRRLDEHKKSWKIYFHDVPQSLTLADLWVRGSGFREFEANFAADAAAGNLPSYAFIEPRYFTNGPLRKIPNDQHPPHSAAYGEQLIATVYNAVRSAPTWPSTLLIITYDEHGGCYDHAPPPLAIDPDLGTMPAAGEAPGPFQRYGVRVPAVIVSPYIGPGTIVRSAPSGLAHVGDGAAKPFPFDHSSIIATLREVFGLGAPLTFRDKVAPSLVPALGPAPANNGPGQVQAAPIATTDDDVIAALSMPPNGMQQSLEMLGRVLPPVGTNVSSYVAALRASGGNPASSGVANVATIGATIARLRGFLG